MKLLHLRYPQPSYGFSSHHSNTTQLSTSPPAHHLQHIGAAPAPSHAWLCASSWGRQLPGLRPHPHASTKPLTSVIQLTSPGKRLTQQMRGDKEPRRQHEGRAARGCAGRDAGRRGGPGTPGSSCQRKQGLV